MEGRGVKYYLAHQVPFTLDKVLAFPEYQMSISKIIYPITPVVRRVADGAEEKELTDKLYGPLKGFRLILGDNKIPNQFRLMFSSDSSGRNLKKALGDAAFLQAEISELEFTSGNGLPQQLQGFTTQELPPEISSRITGNDLQIVDSTINAAAVIDALLRALRLGRPEGVIRGKMSVILIDKARHNDGNCIAPETEQRAMLRRMLDEEIAPDAVILAENGAEVKCHRGILAAQSDVFRAMFGTDMQEAKIRKIEMADMSEEAVRAFLAYLYYGGESKAQERCSVALELLKAGHKYNIGSLEKAMRKLLLSKPETWHEVDVALKMFLFIRNFDAEWEPLKRKAVMVMKKNSEDLENSAAVQQLFQEDPRAALQFYKYSVSLLPETSS